MEIYDGEALRTNENSRNYIGGVITFLERWDFKNCLLHMFNSTRGKCDVSSQVLW
jgi:hypothetical protein